MIQITPAIYTNIADYILENAQTAWRFSRQEQRECDFENLMFEDAKRDLVVSVISATATLVYTTGLGDGGYEEKLEQCYLHLSVEACDENGKTVPTDFSNDELKKYLC